MLCSHFSALPFASRVCYSQGCSRLLLIRNMKERRENGEQTAKRRWEGRKEWKEEGKVGMTENHDREEDIKERREWSWRELRGRDPSHVSCKCDLSSKFHTIYLPAYMCSCTSVLGEGIRSYHCVPRDQTRHQPWWQLPFTCWDILSAQVSLSILKSKKEKLHCRRPLYTMSAGIRDFYILSFIFGF